MTIFLLSFTFFSVIFFHSQHFFFPSKGIIILLKTIRKGRKSLFFLLLLYEHRPLASFSTRQHKVLNYMFVWRLNEIDNTKVMWSSLVTLGYYLFFSLFKLNKYVRWTMYLMSIQFWNLGCSRQEIVTFFFAVDGALSSYGQCISSPGPLLQIYNEIKNFDRKV